MSENHVYEQVTLSREAIHNPGEPRHFMRIKPVKSLVRIIFRDKVLAESRQALRVIEVGRDIYDPVFYIPATDVRVELIGAEKKTFCPLKGHTRYFDLAADQAGGRIKEIAWSYQQTFDFAKMLEGKYAFDAARVVTEEHPLETHQ